MKLWQKGLLTALGGSVFALAIATSGNDTGEARYQRLTRETMTLFQKQGFTPVKTEPVAYAQATYAANAAFCYHLKKNAGDDRTYQGCVDFGRHASLISIKPI